MSFRIARDARQVVGSSIPPLQMGPHHTTADALHDLYFVGTLEEWPDFEQDVRREVEGFNWQRRILKHEARRPQPQYYLTGNKVVVGDESGVHGRFLERVGNTMTGVFQSQGLDISMGDFRCVPVSYDKLPDVAMFNCRGTLVGIGELKTPWVGSHHLQDALNDYGQDEEMKLRRLLAQPAEYIQQLQLKYGFISTYDETIFLRQIFAHGEWRLQYSPVVRREALGRPTAASNPNTSVSVREGIFYMGLMSRHGHEADNVTPWVINPSLHTPYHANTSTDSDANGGGSTNGTGGSNGTN